MAKIRIGVVGLGVIANCVHLPGILGSKDLELVALCDTDEAVLEECSKKYGIDKSHCFTDYNDLVNCEEVDAVDIATPNDVHFEIAKAAIVAKKDYSVEKPITMTTEEADTLAKLTQENNVKSMVCFSYRFKSAARFARDLIAKGTIGEIYHVDMQYFQSWGLPYFETPLKWRFQKHRTGSGALGDLGCHALDLVRFVTQKEYTEIVGHSGTVLKKRKLEDSDGFGEVDVDDFCNSMAQMQDNISVSFQVTRFAYGRGNHQRMEIYGSKGAIIYTLDRSCDEDELELCVGEHYAHDHIYTKLSIPEEYNSDQMQSFADIINDNGDGMAATIFDGQINQHTVNAILKSCEEKTWVQL